MAAPPPPVDPWYRRYWGYYNRPFAGCGCLWTILMVLLIWWLLSLLFAPLAFWRRPPPPAEPVSGLPVRSVVADCAPVRQVS